MKSISINTTIAQAILFSLFFIPLIFIAGCSQFANNSMSEEYIAGLKSAEAYAKQDAINDRCINYPVSLNGNIINNTKKHLDQLKKEKSSDFINGFSRGYRDEYLEYTNLYCDDMDSPDEYIKD